MSTFPSVLTTYTSPQATDRLNNPSHSTIEQAQNSGVSQVEKVIGIDGSAPGTIIGDLRNSASNGGGHVQTVNKGGTGQTSYTKGDLLVATSSSVLAKLGIGADGTALLADSAQASGMKWFSAVSNKILVVNNPTSIVRSTSSVQTTYFAASILANSLGTSNAIRVTGQLPIFETDGNAVSFTLNYGNNVVASLLANVLGYSGGAGKLEGMIVQSQVSSQLGYLKLDTGFKLGITNTNAIFSVISGYGYGNASINSTLDQTLSIVGSVIGTASRTSILTGFFVVEKIA